MSEEKKPRTPGEQWDAVMQAAMGPEARELEEASDEEIDRELRAAGINPDRLAADGNALAARLMREAGIGGGDRETEKENDREHDHEHEHEHDRGRDHPHDDAIRAFVYRAERPFDALQLEEFLSAIVQVYGADLLRYKGILWIEGSERRVVFQGVHMLMASDLGRPWEPDEARSSKMVFIGRNLPQDTIEKGLQHCLAR